MSLFLCVSSCVYRYIRIGCVFCVILSVFVVMSVCVFLNVVFCVCCASANATCVYICCNRLLFVSCLFAVRCYACVFWVCVCEFCCFAFQVVCINDVIECVRFLCVLVFLCCHCCVCLLRFVRVLCLCCFFYVYTNML